MPPIALNFMRWLVAFLVFFPLTWTEIRANLRFYLDKMHILLFLALTGYCINGVTAYLAVNYTTAINASFIQSFSPIVFTLSAFVLYREKLDKIQFVGIFVSLIGVLTIIFNGQLGRLFQMNVNPGDAIMLLSVFSWALYSLIYKKVAGVFNQWPLFTFLICGGLLLNLILVFFDGMISGLDWVTKLNPSHLFWILMLNIFPTLLSYVCWNAAVVKVKAGEAAAFLNLIPLFVTAISVLFLEEKLLLSSLIGGVFIIFGVLLVNKYNGSMD